MFVGANLTYLPMFISGMLGMPRRVVDYAPELATLNLLSTIGAFILGSSVIIFFHNAATSWLRGPKATNNPWNALTLEWQTSSPPPLHNFDEPPVITKGPYDYGVSPSDLSQPAAEVVGD
jgi:cytochrome c oxidase subunit 1